MSQRRRRCQLSFKEALHGLAEWARHARTEPGEAAQLWYRGTVGPIARVYGPGGASVRPRRRVATRVSIVSGIEKKDDVRQRSKTDTTPPILLFENLPTDPTDGTDSTDSTDSTD